MLSKPTYAEAGVWRPDIEGNTSKKVSGPTEVSTLKLSSGAGSAAVSVYDARDLAGCTPTALKWFLDTSTTDNDIQTFSNPIKFGIGVFCVLEQGGGNNPVICISTVTT